MSTLTPASKRVMDRLESATAELFRHGTRPSRASGKTWRITCCHRGEESGEPIVASRRHVIARTHEEATAIATQLLGSLSADIVAVEQVKLAYLRRMQR